MENKNKRESNTQHQQESQNTTNDNTEEQNEGFNYQDLEYVNSNMNDGDQVVPNSNSRSTVEILEPKEEVINEIRKDVNPNIEDFHNLTTGKEYSELYIKRKEIKEKEADKGTKSVVFKELLENKIFDKFGLEEINKYLINKLNKFAHFTLNEEVRKANIKEKGFSQLKWKKGFATIPFQRSYLSNSIKDLMILRNCETDIEFIKEIEEDRLTCNSTENLKKLMNKPMWEFYKEFYKPDDKDSKFNEYFEVLKQQIKKKGAKILTGEKLEIYVEYFVKLYEVHAKLYLIYFVFTKPNQKKENNSNTEEIDNSEESSQNPENEIDNPNLLRRKTYRSNEDICENPSYDRSGTRCIGTQTNILGETANPSSHSDDSVQLNNDNNQNNIPMQIENNTESEENQNESQIFRNCDDIFKIVSETISQDNQEAYKLRIKKGEDSDSEFTLNYDKTLPS